MHWATIIDKVLIPMVVSPLAGFTLAFLLMLSFMWILRSRNPRRVQRRFRMMQPVSAAAMALGHGLQDAQKTMGVIFLALITTGYAAEGDDLPLWVVVTSAAAISLGTYSGGWRIMRTLGRRIIALDPARGFAAETVGAGVLYTTAYVFEAPVSTTQTITSAIMGAGATRRLSAVRWGVARSILVAWVLTVPMAALAAAARLPSSCTWSAGRPDRRSGGSAEAAGDVVLGALVRGVAEDLAWSGRTRPAGRCGCRWSRRGVAVKNAVRSETRAACCMLWVTMMIV